MAMGDFDIDANRFVDEGPQEKAKRLVNIYILEHLEVTDPNPDFKLYVVWFCKTLQNWKALVSTTLPDGMYYEVTYNGDLGETYVDAYKKFKNVVYKDPVTQTVEDLGLEDKPVTSAFAAYQQGPITPGLIFSPDPEHNETPS